MDKVLRQLRATLKQHGQSLTEPRRQIFEALYGKEPQTLRELTLACSAIDRTSVYRTVALFERLGIVRRLPIGWKYKLELTDAFSRHHHHLTCLRCERIISFDERPELANELAVIARRHDFQMQDHQVEIQGLCERCRAA